LPPLVAHVATPDGTHQESMCNWRQTNLPANWWGSSCKCCISYMRKCAWEQGIP